MSERLAEIGADVLHHQAVGDNVERIADAFRRAMSRADVVIATGGLGPTPDDVTREGLALALGRTLERRPEIDDLLREKFARIGRAMPETNLQQADVPTGCRIIVPERGTAPGLACEHEGVLIYAVPGVPAEMREMLQGTILPELSERGGPSVIVSRILRCTGIGESSVSELLDDLFHASVNPTVAYLASDGETRVRLTAKAPSRAEAERLLSPLVDEVLERLGDVVFSVDGEDLEVVVGRALRARRATVACAESLTGGGVAERLSRSPGSSESFAGSAVVYTEEAKRRVLGVREETLTEHGVVSRACAEEMAAGARVAFAADVAIALTGAAGPEPHGGEPPGRIWLALDAGDVRHARTFRAPGDRRQVRRHAEQAALDLLRRYLEGLPLPGSA
jgi:nicotinamide-nucleotide amidase